MVVNVSDSIVFFFLFLAIYFEVFILITFFEGKKRIKADEKMGTGELEHYPSVTIIVPCFNEETTIHGTVKSLLDLDYPADKLGIIIVDDGSRDNTWNIIQEFTSNPRIATYRKENGGKYTALNYGIQQARTDLVGCLDADSFVASDALKKIACHFENKAVMAVTPAIRIWNPTSALQHLQHIEYNIGIFMKKVFGLLGAIHVTPGPFTIFRRDVFKKIGYFRHAHNTEDMEMALRLHNNHYKIENSHTAWVYTVGPRTLKTLYKQRVRWTHGFLENALDYKHLFFNRKYGNVGFLTLPSGTIALLGFVVLMGVSLANLALNLQERVVQYQTVGWNPKFHWSLNLFYWNTQALALLSMMTFFITIALMLISKRMVGDKTFVSRDMFYYFLLYPFIAPLWILKSVYNTAFSRKSTWR